MRIIDLLTKDTLSLSFEVFPPKTESSFESVKNATEEIAKLKPSFMSVTYGAGGGTSKYTLEIAKNIKDSYSVPTLAHLTCVSSTRETVRERIEEMKRFGIENIMALRGDLTDELRQSDRTAWDYRHAVDLIYDIKNSGNEFCIGGACYPEVHPESKDQKDDIKYLKEKVDAGCDFLTTQMFFDNNVLYNFLYRARNAGINVPIIAGVMPVTNAKQIKRTCKLSGTSLPPRFAAIVDKFGDDPRAMKQAGIAYCTEQIIDLIANGVEHIHIYTMNKPDVAAKIMANLSDIIRCDGNS